MLESIKCYVFLYYLVCLMYIGSVSSTNSIAMNKERDIGLLEERELKKELTITEEGKISFTYVSGYLVNE